jgi:nitroreductase
MVAPGPFPSAATRPCLNLLAPGKDLWMISSVPADPTGWEARYGTRPPSDIPDEAFSHLLRHRSVRAYGDQPVADDALSWAIAAAQSASSSSNLQPWSVIAVRDRGKQERLAELAGDQRHVAQAPLFLAWVADWSRLRRLGLAQHIPTEGTDYLESYTIGAVDTALAAQNAAIAFELLGMGIVYIGGMRNHPKRSQKSSVFRLVALSSSACASAIPTRAGLPRSSPASRRRRYSITAAMTCLKRRPPSQTMTAG